MPHIASREEEFSVERICIARKGGGEGGNHTKEVVSGGKRANLTRSCRAITLLVSTNTDDGNSTFQCSPVDTCSDGNSLPGRSIATDKVGWHVASNVASGGG